VFAVRFAATMYASMFLIIGDWQIAVGNSGFFALFFC
jgi:hypothetical protein